MTLIDSARLTHSRIDQSFKARSITRVADINMLTSTSVGEKQSGFYEHIGEFSVPAPVERIWNHYLTSSPLEMWNNKFMKFVMLFNRSSEKVYYTDDQSFPQLEKGILIFINVLFLYGKVNIAVGHEIEIIDPEERLIKTNYLENSKSTGSQYIRFVADGKNQSRIIHTSYYSSGSPFRDKVLYPKLHTLTISAFHKNMIRDFLKQK